MTPAERNRVEEIVRSIDAHIATTRDIGLKHAAYLLEMLRLELVSTAGHDRPEGQPPDLSHH